MDSKNFNKNLALLRILVFRELKVKYRGSILGYVWSMLNPLFFMLIISLVFSKLMRGIENYDLFVLSGILFWNMTAYSLTSGTSSIVANAALLQKVKTPIWIYALVPLGSSLTNFLLALIPYSLILLLKGMIVPWTIVFLPLAIIAYMLFLAGIVLFLSLTNVFFRDVAHVLEPIIQLLFYATPIIYDRSNPVIPENIRFIIGFNPFTRFVELFRQMLFKFDSFHAPSIFYLLISSILFFSFGCLYFNRYKSKIAFKL